MLSIHLSSTQKCLQVATVLTVYGIETVIRVSALAKVLFFGVATVLTVYGIETRNEKNSFCNEGGEKLQQYLPFTVLKLVNSLLL